MERRVVVTTGVGIWILSSALLLTYYRVRRTSFIPGIKPPNIHALPSYFPAAEIRVLKYDIGSKRDGDS